MTKGMMKRQNKRKAQDDVSYINNQINKVMRKRAEHKFFDTTVTASVGTGTNIFALSQNIIQGISGAQRIGDSITYVRLQLNYRIEINPLSVSNITRVTVVLDKMNDGIAPGAGDLFVSSSITSPYSAEQTKSKRFTILHDEICGLNIGGQFNKVVQKTIPMNGTAHYQATTSVVGANGKNSLWVFITASDNANLAAFSMDNQVVFVDP